MVWKLHCLSRWRNGHVIVLEKVFVIGWRRTHNTRRWRTTLIKSERCYWMTVSFVQKIQYVQWPWKRTTLNDFCGASKPSPSTDNGWTKTVERRKKQCHHQLIICDILKYRFILNRSNHSLQGMLKFDCTFKIYTIL